MHVETETIPDVIEVQLTRSEERERVVQLSPVLARKLHVCKDDTLLLRTGAAGTRVKVQVGSSDAGMERLAIPASVMTTLGVSPGQTVHGKLAPGVLRLGPLIGILAPRRNGLTKPYQAQTSLFRRMMVAASELGVLLYVFDFHDIQWKTKRVRGFTFHHGSWSSRMYPLPDVVFDRATGSFPGGSGAADHARRRLAQGHGVKIFNTRIGNKMRMHKLMLADALLRPHLPPTRRVTGSSVVAQVLSHHRGAYLKPENGAMGKGIIRLRRAKGGVRYTLTTMNYQRIQGTAATTSGALAQLRRHVALSRYLVQPELQLIRMHGRICDVRALVQRDADGEWHLTGIGVRAGQPGSVVSNLHGGGRALQLRNVLKDALHADDALVEQIEMQIEQLALRVATVLSQASDCLGELGVDLGVDTQGHVWIIEANSRTGRATFRRAGMPAAALMADRRPLLFAKYLAGFTT